MTVVITPNTQKMSHIDCLKAAYELDFLSLQIAEYYLDAVLKACTEYEKQKMGNTFADLSQRGILVYKYIQENTDYLVIPNINTSEVANKLRGLKK